jgi:integrase
MKGRNDRGWNVYRRGDGTLCIQFRVASGKWRDRRIPRDAARTERQAEKWAAGNVERLRAGEPTTPKVAVPELVRVRDLEDRFLEIRKGMGLRPATVHQDESVFAAHITPLLGDVAIEQLDTAVLLSFVDKLKAAKKSPATIRNVLSVLRSFIDVVRVRKLAPVVVNPTRDPDFVKQGIPRRQRGTKPQLVIEVAERLLTHAALPEHWKVRILIGCTGGLRDGEIAALQWQDLELDPAIPVMRIRKAVAVIGERQHEGKTIRSYGTELGPTKTAGSNRDVPIHPLTVRALRAWKAQGWIEWTGRRAQPSDFVLPSEQGTAWRPRSAAVLREWLLAAKCDDKYAGKPIDFHALRRSFATWLARAGVERSVRKLLLGHVEGDVTEEHYIDRDLAQLYDAVCRIRLDVSSKGKVIALPVVGNARG